MRLLVTFAIVVAFLSVCSCSDPPNAQSVVVFGPVSTSIHHRHHHENTLHPKKQPRYRYAVSPAFPPQQGQDCDGVVCSNPLTSTPIGSPCGCVYPMRVSIDLGVASYQLFARISELEIEVASGLYLKQSQVRIVGASASARDQRTTTVTIDLVPLGEKFDNTTALLMYERFWQKKLLLNETLFGDYEVIYVLYPGLPFSPYAPGVSSSPVGSHQIPLVAIIPTSKNHVATIKSFELIILLSCVTALLCIGVIFFLWKRTKRYPSTVSSVFTPSFQKQTGTRSTMSPSILSSASLSSVPKMPSCPTSVRIFLLSEIEKATSGFSSSRVLGEGGFGRVYHGVLADRHEMAIKVLTREEQYRDKDFVAEAELLGRLHHRNLVKLVGVCIEGQIRCLVYELVRNGSVESHLHGADKWKSPLNWNTRMKIALGAARALAYLHEDAHPHIIHRDFKASNILLEDDFTPKVSDFGLAREVSEGIHHVSTRVMGTFGYVAPEYAMTGHLVVKSDVYSFGVVLLELLTGKKPVYMTKSQEPESLVKHARPLLLSRQGIHQLIDPSLGDDVDIAAAAKFAAIASMCVNPEAAHRPFMGEVVQALKLICNNSADDDNSPIQRGDESSGPECFYRGDSAPESSCWNGSDTPPPRLAAARGFSDLFGTLECISSPPVEDDQRWPLSASRLVGRRAEGGLITWHTISGGAIRTEKQRRELAFYRLRGSISDHEVVSRRFSD